MISIVEIYLFRFSLRESDNIVKISISFIQIWVIILYGFFIFNIFKNLRLPRSYYRIRKIETKRFYDLLLVPAFQFILVNSFFKYLNPRVYVKGRKKDYIITYHKETKQSETSHLLTITLTLFIQGLYLYNGEILLFISLTIFTLIFNLYPILLQRKNRMLLEAKFSKYLELH